jgi:hypothetical protein
MATTNPPDHLLIATGFTLRKLVWILAATATLTLILEFSLIQEEATPPRRRKVKVGALLDMTRAFKATILS